MKEAYAARHISGNGPQGIICERRLSRLMGGARTLLTASCTDALEMCALLLDLQPGDQVIIPSFTFVSTANAFALRGAIPVFADIRSDTLNIDETTLPRLITRKTRAIVVVHYAGVGCEMDAIMSIAKRYRLPVIEDNAHGLFGRYRGKSLGTFGRFSVLSFHETKNISCGEGGALIVNQIGFVARAEIIRDKGTDRARFLRGQTDKYTWRDIGSSFVLADVLAGLLRAQLEQSDTIQTRRRRLWERYRSGLAEWAERNRVRLPFVPDHCEQSFHMFYLLLPDAGARRLLAERLKRGRINAVFHYVPLNLSPMGRHFGGRSGQCPVAESVWGRLLRLPFFPDLSRDDQERVIGEICDIDLKARS